MNEFVAYFAYAFTHLKTYGEGASASYEEELLVLAERMLERLGPFRALLELQVQCRANGWKLHPATPAGVTWAKTVRHRHWSRSVTAATSETSVGYSIKK